MSLEVLSSVLKTLRGKITRAERLDPTTRGDLLTTLARAEGLSQQLLTPGPRRFGRPRQQTSTAVTASDADRIHEFLTTRTEEGFPKASASVLAIELDISVPRVLAALRAYKSHFEQTGSVWRLKPVK